MAGDAVIIVHAEADAFASAAFAIYRSLGTLVVGRPRRAWLRAELRQADVLIVRLGVTVDRELLGWAPRLKVVASPTTGRGHIDERACHERGVRVLTFAGQTHRIASVTATADHAVGLMLALLRDTVRAHEHVVAGGWDRNAFVGREFQALTVGVIGMGRLGTRVARLAGAFGARVVAYDPCVAPERFAEVGATPASLLELVRQSEIVTLHASVTESSCRIVDRALLSQMRPGALLVNTARAELIDHDALVGALTSRQLGGVALDVLPGEPNGGPATDALVALARSGARVILTPHIGGCTSDSLAVAERTLAELVAEETRATLALAP